MKTGVLTAVFCLIVAHIYAADTGNQEKLAGAVKKLGEQANYSWTTSTKEGDGSPGRLSNIEGQAEKGGLTHLSFAVGGVPVEVFLKGAKGAAKALEGWMTLDEIAQTSGTAAAVVRYLRKYKTPVAQTAELAANVKEAKEEDGVLVCDLKDEAIKELLLLGTRARDGQEPPTISGAKGTARFWIDKGQLIKYEIKAQGTVATGDRTTDIDRTMTVKFKDVGSTKIEPPAEAQQKLS